MLNKKLGHDLLITDRQSVETNPDYPLWVDALEFEKQASAYIAYSAFDIEQVNIELNHRVSVGRVNGEEFIQASVIEIDVSNLTPEPFCTRLGYSLK